MYDIKINYNLFINSTGYSTSAISYILALLRIYSDIDIKIRSFNTGFPGVSKNIQQIFSSMRKPTDPESIHIFHSVPTKYERSSKKLNVGFCVFETINLPKSWVFIMNKMDLILTASQFNLGIFEANGVKVPIKVVPHCFDNKMFNKDVQHTGRYAKTTFLAMGTWKQRKNWLSLIKAFYEAFVEKDNVCLLIKTDKPQHLKQTVDNIKRNDRWRTKNTAPIYAEDSGVVPFEDIPSIMKKGDFYISTSLGEGLGLGGLHAAALGIPIITPRFGGCLEYAHPDNCTYINPSKYERLATMDNMPQFDNAIWPVLPVEEIASKMREVYEHYPKEKTEKAYQYVHDNFSYEAIAPKFIEAIKSEI